MSCPVNLRLLPSSVLEEVFTPENMRRRPSGTGVTSLSFPKSRTALWDGSPNGDKLHLHLCSHRAPQLVLLEKALRLAQRHARHTNEPRLLCFFLGRLSVDSDEEGVTLTVDRFDPGRDQATGRAPSASLPGDVVVPCWFSTQSETMLGDGVVQSEAELHQCFKVLQQYLSSRLTLDVSQLIRVRGHVTCTQRLDAASFSLGWSAVCPSLAVDVQPVRPVPIIPTALLRSLTSISRAPRQHAAAASWQKGFLSMDQSRKLLLLLESDPKSSNLPLVGLWLSGMAHVSSPQVWAWCLRFLFSAALQDRVFSESGAFLLVLFASTHRAPQFFQCRGPGPGPGPGPEPQLDWQLLSSSESVTLYQVAPVRGKALRCQLVSEGPSRQTQVFMEARRSFSAATTPAAARLSVSDQDSGVEDEDLSPRPSPSPHPPAQQTRRVQPSVPELSLLIDSSFPSNHNSQSECVPAHRPPPGERKTPAPPSGTSYSSSAPRPPPHLHSTPNSQLQPPCSCCCSHSCSTITSPPGLLLQHLPAASHPHAPPSSNLHTAPPPSSHHSSPPASLHHQTPSPPASDHFTLPSNFHPASPPPPPSCHTPAPPPCQNFIPPYLTNVHPSSSPYTPHLNTTPLHQFVPPSLPHPSPPSSHLSARPPPSCCSCSLPPPPPSLPHCTDSSSPAPLPSPPFLASPSGVGSQYCDRAPGGVLASDTYQLLLHQDRQLRLLQDQVQMLLEAQKKLQASSQQVATTTASVAVETGASLFWGNPVPPLPYQDLQAPPPSPSPRLPAAPTPQDQSVTLPAGGAEEDGAAAPVDPRFPPDPHSLSGIQSPVLGESVSMYTPAPRTHSFYNNLMNQLTTRLQESDVQQVAHQAESRRRSLSDSSSSSSSSQTSSRRSPAGDPVVSATLRQLQQLGVDPESLTESQEGRLRVESASTLASINPAAVLCRLGVSEPTASALFSGGGGASVDLSMEANAIALRYLSDSQLSRMSVGGHAHLQSPAPASSSESLLSPSNMSLATRKYMKRYGLIEEEAEHSEEEEEEAAPPRRPLTDALNVKLLPPGQLTCNSHPKMQLVADGNKENRRGKRPSLVRASSRETEVSVGNILDLSRLRQLPKLF